jgi:endonuclease/exonuclease/phosphatase family metal-dependent hydrolase
MPLKLISVNIEGHRHLERLLPFFKTEQPDIICLQEVFEVDLLQLEAELGMRSSFAPMANVTSTSVHQSHALGSWGIAQLTALPAKEQQAEYYFGSPATLPVFFQNNDPNSMNRAVLWSTVEKDGASFTIGTTHFTWSPQGQHTEEQARDATKLLQILSRRPELILCGDLNSPRAGEPHNLFNTLAKQYTDNIPPEVTTSIDGQYHKAGQLIMMVDSLFSSDAYRVSQVRVVDGLSDHKGIVGIIERV